MILSKIPKQKRVVQSVEESMELRDSSSGGGFWDSVIDFVDMVTDQIPAIKAAKQVGKKIWDSIKSWF